MTKQEVLDLINAQIFTNHSELITANVLNPVLDAIVNQINDKVGDLFDLNTADKSDIVAAINEMITNGGGDFVSYLPQSPTAPEQLQARENLGLPILFDSKLDKSTYTGTAADLKALIDGNTNNFQYYILLSDKGQPLGVASLDSNGKLPAGQLPDLAITSVKVAVETTLADFAANSANYTFEEGDVIVITNAGNTSHYIFKGGVKTDVANYSQISADEILISQVQGLQAALDAKQEQLSTDGSLYIDLNVIRANLSTYSQTLTKAAGGNQVFTLDFEPTNFLAVHSRISLFESDYIFIPPNTLEIIPEMADGEKIRIVYEHFINQP